VPGLESERALDAISAHVEPERRFSFRSGTDRISIDLRTAIPSPRVACHRRPGVKLLGHAA
jgi:hypothetical protein